MRMQCDAYLANFVGVHANARDIGCEDVMDREYDALWRILLISENAGEPAFPRPNLPSPDAYKVL